MRERFVVEGLAGEKKLEGEIPVRGAKNAVLKSFAATLLFRDKVTIGNVPHIEDVDRECEILEALGATVIKDDERTYTVDTTAVASASLDDALARRLRASIIFTGPLLARFGEVSFPHPGGDVIGPRPINLFLDGFKKMGAELETEGERYTLRAKNGLKGAEIFFMFVSVTATETLLMAAVGAEGTTTLKNVAMEPEIVELANFLVSCGAKISGIGTPTMTIEGTGLLSANGKIFNTIPDRIETGTFLLLGALAGKEVTIADCNPFHVEMLTALLRESGTSIDIDGTKMRVRATAEPLALQVRTHEYPGFATDMQPPMVVYLTQAKGESTMFETIFSGRLNYTQDLTRMGADIKLWNPQQIAIQGPTPLMAAELESPDIRAGLAFVMAAVIAKGTSTVGSIYHIDRGYEHIEERLKKLGLNIKREAV